MKRTMMGGAVMAAFAVVLGAGAAHADDPWPDPTVKGDSASGKVVVLDDPWPDPTVKVKGLGR